MAASSTSPTGSPSTTLPTEASAKVGPADRQDGAAHTGLVDCIEGSTALLRVALITAYADSDQPFITQLTRRIAYNDSVVANARLIAAAPEQNALLLRALEIHDDDTLEAWQRMNAWDEWAADAREITAKARGK